MLTLLVAPLLGAFPQDPPQFHPPVRLKAGDDYVRVEAPGFAYPCLHDVDKDGKKDLVVGQFAGGKMKLWMGLGGAWFAAGDWLQAEGDVAEVPGVW
jgi:hypothetical protein